MEDPLESYNRAIFTFNESLLDHVVDPLARVGEAWLPPEAREAARNIYANVSEPEFIVTNLLQGNVTDAAISFERVAVNSTLGIAGVFDVATGLGMDRRAPEFAESVCSLGVPPGAYLVMPVIGSTNVNALAVLTTLWVGHLYVISLISNWLLAADLILDAAVATATLRHSADAVDETSSDPYSVQRSEYYQYIDAGCVTGVPGVGGPELATTVGK